MSLVPVTVELPQYTQSFVVDVLPTHTVRDIKQEISRACPGNPRVDGQRLISRGRILDDAERVESLWLVEAEARVVHLAVSPWAWTAGPPEVPSNPSSAPPSQDVQPVVPEASERPLQRPVHQRRDVADDVSSRLQQYYPSTSPLPRNHDTLPYIQHIHSTALRILSPSAPSPTHAPVEFVNQKELTTQWLQAAGCTWPSIFDEEYPPLTEGGVTYEYTMIGGKPFLQNLTAHATPTPRQQHALNVLAYTFPLLSLPVTPAYYPGVLSMRPPPMNINNLGGPFGNPDVGAAVRIGADARGPGVAVRIPVRAILTPLLFLCLRTLLLLYFFSPARKPIFGFMLGVWVLYEAWGAVRGAIFDNIRDGHGHGNRGAGRLFPQRRHMEDDDGFDGRPGGIAFPPHQNPARATALAASSADAILSRFAQLDLDEEARALDDIGAPEPGLFTKVRVFVSLLVLTLHPAFWNRRRAALRTREGRVRTEATARETAPTQEGEGGEGGDERVRQAREQLLMQHAQKPAWVQEYVERVRRGDWVDD
ncbi:hypothetical protein M0805_007287 [Coniferiporia weirii]|nr:hypothetical protein M0805_007287 [Coniferiporia weirii]